MTKQMRRKHTPEFRREAVRLVTDEGYKIAEAARSLDINANMAKTIKEPLRYSLVHVRCTRVPPRAVPVGGARPGACLRNPQSHQLPGPRERALPLPPKVLPQMAAYPAIQLLEDTLYPRMAEVVDPTPKFRGQFGNGSPDGAAFGRTEECLNVAFESLDRLGSHLQTYVVFPTADGVAKKAALPWSIHRTLFPVHPQFQPSFQKSSH